MRLGRALIPSPAPIALIAAFLAAFPPGAAAARAGGPPGGDAAFPVLAEEMLQPDARQGNTSDTGLAETGTHPLLGSILWRGRRFLHFQHRTYWTADGGRTWKSHGWMDGSAPKPQHPILPDARFRATGSGLYLSAGPGGPALAAAFDSSRNDFGVMDFGRASGSAPAAFGCGAGVLYLYDAARTLSASDDVGLTWRTVATVPPADGASAFDDVEADGARLLLRYRRPYGVAAAAGSMDGGRTWRHFPAGADVHLQGGCFQWLAEDSLRAQCGPDAPDWIAPAPFAKLDRLFRQESGELFALADSSLFHFRAGSAAEGDGPVWEPVEAFARKAGWVMAGEVLALQTQDRIAWVSPGNATAVTLVPRRFPRRSVDPRFGVPEWLEQGRRPDGRAVRHHSLW